MTRYAAQTVTPYRDHRNVDIYPDHRDTPRALFVYNYTYTPADPNPDDCEETYRPVTLDWSIPDNGIYATMPVATNGHRGNRVYRITGSIDAGYGVSVNGLHIPVKFNSWTDAELFAQHIEDDNTED